MANYGCEKRRSMEIIEFFLINSCALTTPNYDMEEGK
jgi:hypothetical protein